MCEHGERPFTILSFELETVRYIGMVLAEVSEFAWLFTITDALSVEESSSENYVGFDAFAQVGDNMIYAYVKPTKTQVTLI